MNKAILGIVTLAMIISPSVTISVGGDNPGEEQPFIEWYAPEDSFGIQNMTLVNWSYFWKMFKQHSLWDLEIYNPQTTLWESHKEALTVQKNRSADNTSEKITLIFDAIAPIRTDYRLTFAIDARVSEYVNKSGQHEYTLTYPINDTGLSYTVYFNWSDMAAIPGIRFSHGIKTLGGKDYFWFRARRDDVPPGAHVELDPTFGYETGANPAMNIEDEIRASYATTGSEGGYLHTISAYVQKSNGANINAMCALYEYDGVDDAGNIVGITRSTTITGNGWFDFDVATPFWIDGSTTYYLAIMGDTDGGAVTLKVAHVRGQNSVSVARDYTLGFPDPMIGEGQDTDKRYSIYGTYSLVPTMTNENPTNQTTNNSVNPSLQITVDDGDDDSLDVTFESNSSGSWVEFASNNSVDTSSGAVTLYQTNANFSDYGTTYYWSVECDDGTSTNKSYYEFTTGELNTSVDDITPYLIYGTELQINTSNYGLTPDNATLWYRYSEDNSTWGSNYTSPIFFDDFDTATQGADLSSWGNWSDGDGDFKWKGGAYTPSSYTGCGISSQQYPYGGSGKSLYIEASGRYNKDYYFVSDEFVIDGCSNVSVDLRYHMYGANINLFEIQVSNGSTWDTLFKRSGQQHVAYSTPWNHEVTWINGSLYEGTRQVRIYGRTGASYKADVCVDHIYINKTIIGGWQEWADASNPDASEPWQYTFDFPNISGYYEFAGVAQLDGVTEPLPATADADCEFQYAAIFFGMLDGDGDGTGGDPLYDEVPANNSWVSINPDGITTSLSVDYTNHNGYYLGEQSLDGSAGYSFGHLAITAQSFTVNESEDVYLNNISVFLQCAIGQERNESFMGHLFENDAMGQPIITSGYNVTFSLFLKEQPTWYTYSLPLSRTLRLESGKNYTFGLQPLNTEILYRFWRLGSGNPYENGSRWSYLFSTEKWTEYSSFDFCFKTSFINASNVSFVNVTFDWYNDTLGDWEQYGNYSYVANATISQFNTNFSGIDTYTWRVSAVANDTGVTNKEIYTFNTFYQPLVNAANTHPRKLTLACSFGAFGIVPLIFFLDRKKKRQG